MRGASLPIADLERILWEEIVKRDHGVSVLSGWSPSWYRFPENWPLYFRMHQRAHPLDRVQLDHLDGRHRGNRALSEHWHQLSLLSPSENVNKTRAMRREIERYLVRVGPPTERFERARQALEDRIHTARYPDGTLATGSSDPPPT